MSSISLESYVRDGHGRVHYDIQPNTVCTEIKSVSPSTRVTAKECETISPSCDSYCALAKSKGKAFSSYLRQLYEAYPCQVAGTAVSGRAASGLAMNETLLGGRWRQGGGHLDDDALDNDWSSEEDL